MVKNLFFKRLGLIFVLLALVNNFHALAQPGHGESVIQRIQERDNTLLAGVKYDFAPFGFVDAQGEVVGFDVDLIRAMADMWGVSIEFVAVTSSDRIPKLVAGEVDLVAASMTHTKDRDEFIDFSQTYFLDGQDLLVRAVSGITDITDLDGMRIAAVTGSTSIVQIETYAIQNNMSIEVFPFQDYTAALASLKDGTVDALTSDSSLLSYSAQQDSELNIVGKPFTNEPYGLGVPEGDSYFRNLVDFTLQQLKKNGT